MQKFLAAMLSLITTALYFPQTRLHAAHATPLFHATREYRDATQYLSRLLTYHAALDPTQRMFLNRLIHSSHQLYAEVQSSPFHAGGPLGPGFRETWSNIRVLMQDLPWILELLPPEAKQRLAPHYRQFLATFQTLAVQIELSHPICEPYPRGGSLAAVPVRVPRQMPMLRADLTPFPQASQHDQTRAYRADWERLRTIHLSRQTLSPSEWQSQRAGTRPRSETPIRREASMAGALLTRLVRTR